MGKNLEKITVICVDDEEMILVSLRSQLRHLNDLQMDVELEFFQNASDALELIEELIEEGERIPLVISDQIMPGMKGDEFLSKVHQCTPSSKTILLTGQASIDSIQRAVNEANLYRYLSKPWEQADLLLTAKEAIRSWHQARQIEAQQESIKKINEVFSRFVPYPFLKRLAVGEKIENLEVGFAQRVDLTVVFTDIRGFTSFSEHTAPEALLKFLNDYLEEITPCIHKENGFIDKFIGDAIMALFDQKSHGQQAASSAYAMIERLKVFNRHHTHQIQMGIGIHSGTVVMGTVGTQHRMDSTVLGDVVNVASRLESMTKIYGCPILISEESLKQGAHLFAHRYLGFVQVKGRQSAIRFYELYSDLDENVQQQRKMAHGIFEEALEAYENQIFEKAIQGFSDYLQRFPQDGPSLYYLKATQDAIDHPENWSSLIKMAEK
jgi:two-component system sensor histidine kinase ChiS